MPFALFLIPLYICIISPIALQYKMNKEKIKILFVTTWFPHEENKHKGIFILEHARAVASTGIEVRVLFINIIHSKSLFHYKYDEYHEHNIKFIKKKLSQFSGNSFI